MSKNDVSILKRFRSWVIAIPVGLLLFFFVRIFIISTENVSSYDMSPALVRGDLVLISHWNKEPGRGDILTFYYAKHDSAEKAMQFIQRCIGLAGDSLYLLNGYVYVNRKEENPFYSLKHNYHVKTKANIDSAFIWKYGLWEGGVVSDELDYSFSLTQDIADSLAKDSIVTLVEKKKEKSDARDEEIFPHNAKYRWNKYNTDIIYIPKRGDELKLDTNTICFYERIVREEGNLLEIRNDSIWINKNLVKTYIVKNNYYFMLGDNRDNAIDSRYWGFLSDKFIKGKVIRILTRRKNKFP